MNMRLLNENEITKIYKNYMPYDFAKNEIKPLSRILELCKLEKYFCYGFYEKQEQGSEKMIAYVFLVTSENRKAVLVDYFAVSDGIRGLGYGSKCFEMLQDKVKERNLGTLFLEVENPDFGMDEAEQLLRKRRIAFYIRNGMTLTNLRIFLYDVEYLLMTSDASEKADVKEQIYAVYKVLLKPDKIQSKLKITTEKSMEKTYVM
ncbi:MAG: GNAT family N-acetyltransferase [Lachnospiraceae bacterium]|nr:GNAT family N-acetyltransferase [Lachnospiraceae bacterium]